MKESQITVVVLSRFHRIRWSKALAPSAVSIEIGVSDFIHHVATGILAIDLHEIAVLTISFLYGVFRGSLSSTNAKNKPFAPNLHGRPLIEPSLYT